jgi:hypothetical protein
MDFSEVYGEYDVGVKATAPDDHFHPPVDWYVDRHELETFQERFWCAYFEVQSW